MGLDLDLASCGPNPRCPDIQDRITERRQLGGLHLRDEDAMLFGACDAIEAQSRFIEYDVAALAQEIDPQREHAVDAICLLRKLPQVANDLLFPWQSVTTQEYPL